MRFTDGVALSTAERSGSFSRWRSLLAPPRSPVEVVTGDADVVDARNHRGRFVWYGRKPGLSAAEKSGLAAFTIRMKSDDPIELEGDMDTEIKKWRLPEADRDYRMKIRRVCRALVKAGIRRPDELKSIEDTTGIPVVGILK